jgi:glycosyltransferase involved in cell wall biosynthesis
LTAIKVAHITTIDLSLRYLLLNQLYSIQQAGYEVYGISSPGPNTPLLEAFNIHHIPAPMTRNVTPLADLVALGRLYQIMRRERFTIVHGHTPKAEMLGQVAARLAGVPIVVDTFRGIYFRQDMHPLWRRLFIMISRVAAGCADVILSQSRWAIDMAIQEGICSPEKIKYLGNGIDIQQFDRSQVSQAHLNRLRVELDLPLNAPIVGFVGRLVREKGVLELLQAAQIVQRQIPSVRFLLVGPRDEEKPDALQPEIARKYGLTETCIFTGPRHDMPELYALMDVFALPTHRESFPRSPMEASAMGVPCVLTDIPGCREVVDHDQNGWLVPLGDVSALAEALIRLLTDPTQARRLGEAGRRIAHERFDERLTFARVKAEYSRLLRAKGLPTPAAQAEAATA